MPIFNPLGCCCGAKTISGVGGNLPVKVIQAYLKTTTGGRKLDPVSKTYVVSDQLNIQDAHLIFAGPETKKKSTYRTFARYIETNNLGSVVASEPAHNPLHSERKPGKLDLVIFIWTLDHKALGKWWLENKPAVDGSLLRGQP